MTYFSMYNFGALGTFSQLRFSELQVLMEIFIAPDFYIYLKPSLTRFQYELEGSKNVISRILMGLLFIHFIKTRRFFPTHYT
jgi:hypothetical protein